eukprot:g41702.t1
MIWELVHPIVVHCDHICRKCWLFEELQLINSESEFQTLRHIREGESWLDAVFQEADKLLRLTTLNLTTLPNKPELQESGAAVSVGAITKEKVLGKLKGLKVDKSFGAVGLYPRVLKEIAEEILEALVVIFQESPESGSVPEDWKVRNVTPLFKKGGRQKTGNYRPVSLTSVIGKILEIRFYIIKDEIAEFLEVHDKIGLIQHGFVKRRSCLTNLFEFFEELPVGKANAMLAVISRQLEYKNRDVLLRLYKSVVRQHLKYCEQFWAVYLRKDGLALEGSREEEHKISGVVKLQEFVENRFCLYEFPGVSAALKSRVALNRGYCNLCL